jgi:hypothetical protein
MRPLLPPLGICAALCWFLRVPPDVKHILVIHTDVANIIPSQAINRTVDIIDCQHAEVDLEVILGIKAFNLDKLMEKDPEFLVRCSHF